MDDSDRQIELFKAQLQKELKSFEAELESKQAVWVETQVRSREAWLHELQSLRVMLKAIVDFALVTIRSLILVNGGAIIGVVSFTGNLWGHNGPAAKATAQAIAPAVGWFVGGLTTALLTSAFAFFAQVFFAELARPQPALKVGGACRLAAVLLAIGSLVCFVVGAYRCLAAFESPVPF